MHSNTSGGQENQVEENPKAKIDQAEELEELKKTISENEETIALLEGKLKKLEETIQKVVDRTTIFLIIRIFVVFYFSMKSFVLKRKSKSIKWPKN